MACVLMRRWSLAAAVLGALGGTAEAALVVDQENLAIDSQGSYFLGDIFEIELAQTFTVGVTGTLGRVEVQLGRAYEGITSPVRIDIVRTTEGIPDPGAGVLATLSLPAVAFPIGSSVETLTGSDLGGMAFPVSQGEVLALALSVPVGAVFYWPISLTGYPRGQKFTSLGPDPFNPDGDTDFGFRTYVETTVVPEPSSLALGVEVAMALLGGGWLRRRRSAAVRA